MLCLLWMQLICLWMVSLPVVFFVWSTVCSSPSVAETGSDGRETKSVTAVGNKSRQHMCTNRHYIQIVSMTHTDHFCRIVFDIWTIWTAGRKNIMNNKEGRMNCRILWITWNSDSFYQEIQWSSTMLSLVSVKTFLQTGLDLEFHYMKLQ